MTTQPGYQIIALDILPNISRSKDHQKMKLGQLIEYVEFGHARLSQDLKIFKN